MKTKINHRDHLKTLKCILLWALMPASLASAQSIPIANLFGTGVNPAGTGLQPIGSVDAHWVLATPYPTSASGQPVGLPSTLMYGPAYVNTPTPAWLANGPSTQWVTPQVSVGAGGNYIYQTTFDIPGGYDPSTATISGWWSSDNEGIAAWLNDIPLAGFPVPAAGPPGGFDAMTNFTITHGVAGATFLPGLNKLTFQLRNRGGGGIDNNPTDTGLRVQFTGSLITQFPPCCGSWELASGGPDPSARQHHAMAYDSARHVVVLFGGSDSSGYKGDTWEWNGTVWTLKATTGPSPRNESAMVFDSARGVVVLFGGGQNNNPQTNNDTWEWNGTAWTLRTQSGPSARVRHAMAYDSARGVTVLFGGLDASGPGGSLVNKADTWEWNGATWANPMPANSPSARESHAMAYDRARGRTVLFGGFGSSVFGDTWEWNGATWTLMASSGPTPRFDHAMAYGGGCPHTLLFGGNDNVVGRVDDSWDWNGTAWSQVSVMTSNPSARNGHKIAYDNTRRRFVLFGGYALPSGVNAETWEFNTGQITTFCAGLNDDFSLALPADPLPFRRPPLDMLSLIWTGFDDTTANHYVGNSFTGLPLQIVGAELEIRLKPLQNGSGSFNDAINIGLPSPNGGTYNSFIRTLPGAGGGWEPSTNQPTTFTLDIGALPQPSNTPLLTNLLSKLNADGLLDVYLQDDTSADYICLRVWTCPHCVIAPRSLVLWLPFDESAGPLATNAAGGNNGAHVSGPIVVNQYVGNGLLFNGNAYVKVPNYPAINPGTGNLSIDAWVKRDPASGNSPPRIIVDKRAANGVGYSLAVSFGNLLFQLADGGASPGFTNYRDSGTVPADNQWHFVAVTVNRTSITGGRFYVDGNPTGTFDPTDRPLSLDNPGAFQVGASAVGGNGRWLGGIDEVEVFSCVRVPRQDEIVSIFNARRLGKCKSSCLVPWDKNFCAGQTLVVGAKIHNTAGVPQTYNYSFQGLPAMPNAHPPCPIAGPTSFSPASGSVTVQPGQTANIPVTIGHHAGNQVGCYEMNVQVVGTGETFSSKGSVLDSRICAVLPAGGVFAGRGVSTLVPLVVTNNGAQSISLPYAISVQRDDMQLDQEFVRLNGLPPGTVVTGTLMLSPSQTTTINVGVDFLDYDPLRTYTLLVEADVDGDGQREPLESTILQNVLVLGPELQSAVSRKIQGAAGPFDIPLPLIGAPGIECRRDAIAPTGHTLVFTINKNVVSGSASVTAGTGSVNGAPNFSGNQMTVNLTGVNNLQVVTVTISNVKDSDGLILPDTSVSMRVLLGDTNGDGVVDDFDVAQTQSRIGQTVDETNFRSDVNVDGVIDATDVEIIQANIVPPVTQAINLSTRMRVQVGDKVGIGGFIITGSASKHVIVRGIGPSLIHNGLTNVLADPIIELHGPGGFTTVINDNWKDTQQGPIAATGLAPNNDLESAIDATLAPGAYTAVVKGKNNTQGVALVEVYDLSPSTGKLGNISTRAFVDTGDNIVIAGIVLGNGPDLDRVVMRGIGPSLAPSFFPASAVLSNPTLELRDENGTLIMSNDDWQDNAAQAAEITAAGLAPTNTLESAIAASLPPGFYTVLLAGLNNGTGIGLVEIYDRGP